MAQDITGKKVAILVANGFEQVELTEPRKALEDAGAETDLISPEKGKVKGWDMKDWGEEFEIDVPLDSAIGVGCARAAHLLAQDQPAVLARYADGASSRLRDPRHDFLVD